ncbi:O-antigen ligase family protein [Feifania hominis]|uniref:O-antigen ligase family protein n=1 Tax=Feifania hominis TaxID=2763660 RepID=A0A926HPD7_9FIRM|nr:O-antigen ligase family protein [Feifania hominis]MBC8535172.1 O-antigen ligase family protein [Feifania hominis]
MEQDRRGPGARLREWLHNVAEGSFFNRIAGKITDFFYRQGAKSKFAGVLTTYPSFTEKKKDSFLYRIFVDLPAKPARAIKKYLTKLYDESVFSGIVSQFSAYLLSTNLISWGLGFIAFGAGIVGMSVLRYLMGGSASLFNTEDFIAVIAVIAGFLFMTSHLSIAQAVLQSRFFHWLIVDVAGFRSEWLEQSGPAATRPIVPLAVGLACGLSTYLFPFYLLPGLLIGLVLVLMIFKVTELGVLLTATLLPFLPTMALVGLMGITLVSFACKYIRGKRAIHFEFLDLMILFFLAALILFGGITSALPAQSLKNVLVYTVFILGYFVIVNTLRSTELVRRALFGMVGSGAVAGLLGLFQYVVGVERSLIWVDTTMFTNIGSRVFGPFDNPNVFGEYLVIMVPIAAALFCVTRGKARYFCLGAFGVMGLSLIFTFSRGAWVAFILAFAVFLVLYDRVFAKLALLLVLALPFLPMVLPANIVQRFASIGNLADTSTAYRVSIWTAGLKMVRDFWSTGIGTGSAVFMLVYPSYALSGAGYALHAHNLYLNLFIELGIVGIVSFALVLLFYFKTVFGGYATVTDRFTRVMLLGLGCGMLGILVQGLTDNVWFNYRIFLFFWVIVGITASAYRSHFEERGETL